MRIHSNILTESDVREALIKATKRGGVDRMTDFAELNPRGSRSHKQAFEVRLEWLGTKIKGDGRRWTNGGNYGSGSSYAATRDEWGWFIAELFQMDEHATVGPYKGMDDFDTSTRYAYVIENPLAV
jgi:hypothetical protein